MGLAIAAVACLVILVSIAIAYPDLLKVDSKVDKVTRENLRLEVQVAELQETIKLLDQKNVKLASELLAHRNKLPWVNVEEIDGPQE